jgi:glutamine synthetase
MKIGVDALVPLPKDATDRNRTSPFAFTGNKFEFRGPGSSQSCAGACVIINTIVAESMDKISSELETFAPEEFNTKLQSLLQKIIKKHKKIIFNGDNYSQEWEDEAARRKLPNLRTTVEALQPLLKKENIELCEKYGVFSETELKSRYEVFLSEYERRIRIEGALSLELARNVILPVVQEDLTARLDLLDKSNRTNITVSALQQGAQNFADKMNNLINECAELENALQYSGTAEILSSMERLRKTVDFLETQIDDRRWPLPKYREMLFIY